MNLRVPENLQPQKQQQKHRQQQQQQQQQQQIRDQESHFRYLFSLFLLRQICDKVMTCDVTTFRQT